MYIFKVTMHPRFLYFWCVYPYHFWYVFLCMQCWSSLVSRSDDVCFWKTCIYTQEPRRHTAHISDAIYIFGCHSSYTLSYMPSYSQKRFECGRSKIAPVNTLICGYQVLLKYLTSRFTLTKQVLVASNKWISICTQKPERKARSTS